jgi:putative ABC transport system permease protein
MKYLPLVWANVWRKPIRAVFTFISIVLGFTLLGLALGLHSSLHNIAAGARPDRIYTSAKFDGRLRIGQREQIARLRGVAQVAGLDGIEGYYQRPGNNVGVLMLGPGMRKVFPELSLSGSQWDMFAAARDGVFVSRIIAQKYGLKPGTKLPLIAPGTQRSDGAGLWIFNVLGVVPDIALLPVGFVVGRYEYLDEARPQADRGEVSLFWILTQDASQADAVASEIDRIFANSSLPTRSVSERSMLESTAGGRSGSVVAITALALVGVLLILLLTSNAIGQSVRERRGELAVLKTLGFSAVAVAALVLVEAAIPCVLGCCCGLAISAFTAAIMPFISPPGFVLPEPDIGLSVVGCAVGAAVLIAALAAAIPALRMARLDVATSLAKR